jgi:hypothetical protein
MFIMVITGIFLLAGLLHPEEFMNLIPGILYFLCIPSGFLLLFIYAMINMKNVSWGTREMPKVPLDTSNSRVPFLDLPICNLHIFPYKGILGNI